MIDLKKSLGLEALHESVQNGEVIQTNDERKGGAATAILVNAPSAKVWGIISDYGSYPETFWLVQDAAVVKEGKGGTIVSFTVGFSFLVIKLGAHFTLKLTHKGKNRMEFTLVKGDLERLSGFWEVIPVEDGKKTVLVYSMDTEVASLGWFLKTLLKHYPAFEPILNAGVASLIVRSVKSKSESSH